ncbi:MAG: helix-turn-helix transcriptional regulator [Pseudobutyrivibrio sp.]|nr:helix-turn-helix transcriptional regulator [Pseudobutyrivibrio sp.]
MLSLKSEKKFLFSQMLDRKIIIDDDNLKSIEKDYKYSQELEKEVEKILVKGNANTWKEWSNSFTKGLEGKCYNPASVRQLYLNLANYIIQLAIKIWPDKGRQLRELESVEKISKAKVLYELKECLDEQAMLIYASETTRDDIHNYTILKAIAYIRENYANKIAQEDVANYLSITPEYLSTLFHREMNKTFSAFVNEFRVSHAKRLLKGSDLKIYEIAERVGFTDTKYFNRVFKDIEGVSPKEFRER